MKCVCTQENLSQGLTIVSHLAAKNANLPILNNILVRAEKGGLSLLATNLEIGITRRVRGKVENEGSITVPARVFAEYVSLLKQDQVLLEEKDATLTIQSENTKTTLRGMASEDFPLIPQVERKNPALCRAADLREGISQVLFAAAYDDARPEISGVLIRLSAKSITLAATDSYRLAEKTLQLTNVVATEVSVIIPTRTLQELARILSSEGDVEIYLGANQALFVYQETELVSRLIDGQYPDYQQIIPSSHETQVTAPTAEVLQAVRATSLFSRPGINDIILTVDPEKHQLGFHASNSQVGENQQSITVSAEGKQNSIVFNSRYLIDGLTNLKSDEVVFEMSNNASPGLFRPAKKNGYLYIIMPIKQ